ncbi:MAG: RNA polymerase sigma-70 factor [Bacteroidales bacterium]|nr:RNA polymerase sigma-70 factor [Bacteroidales bacterium]
MKEQDTVMMESIQSGDLQVFEVFFRAYYQPLCYYALRYVSSPDVAEEIVQDLFYTIWEKREELNITTSLKAYIYTATHNRCMKYLNHRKIEQKYEKHYRNVSTDQYEPAVDPTSMHEIQRIINQTLDSLPEKCSRIFRLNRFEGLRYIDIAKKLSISVKTVEANMGRALKILRKNLKEYVETA